MMEINRFERPWASDAFAENVAAIWRATPPEVERFAARRGWRVAVETASPDWGQSIACADKAVKTITYYEYCWLDGKRVTSGADAKVHYHELIHLMDAEPVGFRVANAIREYKNYTAFENDYRRLSTKDIAEYSHYLSIDRVFEMPPELRMSEQCFGWTVAMREARAQAAAEYIVDGHGPIMELAPATTKRVLGDIKRTLPSLLKLSPAYGR